MKVIGCPNCHAPLRLRMVDPAEDERASSWVVKLLTIEEAVERLGERKFSTGGALGEMLAARVIVRYGAIECPACHALCTPIGGPPSLSRVIGRAEVWSEDLWLERSCT